MTTMRTTSDDIPTLSYEQRHDQHRVHAREYASSSISTPSRSRKPAPTHRPKFSTGNVHQHTPLPSPRCAISQSDEYTDKGRCFPPPPTLPPPPPASRTARVAPKCPLDSVDSTAQSQKGTESPEFVCCARSYVVLLILRLGLTPNPPPALSARGWRRTPPPRGQPRVRGRTPGGCGPLSGPRRPGRKVGSALGGMSAIRSRCTW